ncbi:MAG: shikimate dehydrogenase family protein, partial [Ktedonobacterales bacterium]
AEPWLAARRQDAAAALLAEMCGRHGGNHAAHALDLADERAVAEALRKTTVLVNATPIGTLDAAASPIPLALLDALPSEAYIFDMVYNPPTTALVRAARDRGLRASGGLPMLLYQGAEAFTLWTGQPAPLVAMRTALGLV